MRSAATANSFINPRYTISSVFRDLLIPLKLLTKISKSRKLFLPRIFVIGGARREERQANFEFEWANHVRVLRSSRKPMRKTPVSGFPRALPSLSHTRKRKALASRLFHFKLVVLRVRSTRFEALRMLPTTCFQCQNTQIFHEIRTILRVKKKKVGWKCDLSMIKVSYNCIQYF